MQFALAFALLAVGQADPVFDLPALLKPPLDAKVLKSTENDEIITEEIRFYSHTDFEKRIEIFGIFCYPKGARKLPAFVWNQGGLAQASSYWPEFGAKRGYAVLCIDFPIGGYRSTGGYPINSGVELPENPKKAPIYHGAVALLRAVSFLESRPEVDAKKIGMAGSSWGGFYTTLMAGVDPRIKAASSMFGSGSMGLGNAWWDGTPQPDRDAAFRQRWAGSLDPALRLPKSKAAIGWFTGTNDSFYWLPGVIETYRLTAQPKHLALLPNWNHALDEAMDEQVFRWLDIHLKGGTDPFLTLSPIDIEGREVRWAQSGDRKPVRGEMLVSFGTEGSWTNRFWVSVPAKREANGWIAKLAPTKAPAIFYGCVTDDDGNRSCTPLASLPGVAIGPTTLPFDGCSMWCTPRGFVKTWHERHGYQLPKLEARGEKTIAKIQGKATLGPIYYAPGINHRLTVEGKLAGATAELVGFFDGKKTTQELTIMGDRIFSEFRVPEAKSGNLNLVINGTADGSTIVERVRFEPVE